MKVTPTAIPDVRLIEPQVFSDDRGFFFESWNARAFAAAGVDAAFVQDNHSRSRRGVLRGLHYQIEHAQGKLVRCVAGEVFDVAVDLRRSVADVRPLGRRRAVGATTGGCSGSRPASRTASSSCPRAPTSSTRRPTTGIPEHERTLLWNDPALAIAWPRRRARRHREGRRGHAARGGRRLPVDRAPREAMRRPTILVTGAAGQVGFELVRLLAPHGDVVAADRARLDLADPDAIVAAVRGAKPASDRQRGAYTAVDLAEKEAELAAAVNARAPGILAEEAKRAGAVLIHYSTDYVFDGARTTPYPEDAPTAPLNVYGATQARGRARDRGGRRRGARVPHELGLRPARQEFPADDRATRRRARRAPDRRRPDRRAQLVPGARRGDGTHRRRRTARAGRARGALSPELDGPRELVRLRAGDRRRRRPSRASCRSRPPSTRCRRAVRRTACSTRRASRRRSVSRCRTGATRSRAASRARQSRVEARTGTLSGSRRGSPRPGGR